MGGHAYNTYWGKSVDYMKLEKRLIKIYRRKDYKFFLLLFFQKILAIIIYPKNFLKFSQVVTCVTMCKSVAIQMFAFVCVKQMFAFVCMKKAT